LFDEVTDVPRNSCPRYGCAYVRWSAEGDDGSNALVFGEKDVVLETIWEVVNFDDAAVVWDSGH